MLPRRVSLPHLHARPVRRRVRSRLMRLLINALIACLLVTAASSLSLGLYLDTFSTVVMGSGVALVTTLLACVLICWLERSRWHRVTPTPQEKRP